MRTCGQCTACCTACGVVTLGKAPGEPCQYEAKTKEARTVGGCLVYDERPAECRSYECLWLLGFGKPSARPDRSGVLLEGQKTVLGYTLVVTELRPRALDVFKHRKDLRGFGVGLWIRRADGSREIEGSPGFIERAKKHGENIRDFDGRVRLKVLAAT